MPKHHHHRQFHLHRVEMACTAVNGYRVALDVFQAQQWSFQDAVPSNIDSMRNLLQHYSSIPPSDIDAHLLRIVCLPFLCSFVI